MGLDSYLLVQNDETYDKDQYDPSEWDLCDFKSDLATWRNFWDLHEAMENLWEQKGRPEFFENNKYCPSSDFNCVHFQITVKELEKIFREVDPDFDEVIDTDDMEPDELLDVEYYRKQNRDILEQLKGDPDKIILYKGWH